MPFPVTRFRQSLRLLAAIFVALVGLALVNVTMAQLHAPQQAKHTLPGEPPTSSTTKPSEAETVQFAELAAATGGMAGFVTAPGGAPLSEIEVEVYQKQPWGWEVVESAVTDPSGHYLIPSLETGIYRLRFLDPEGDYAPEFYGHAMSVDEAADIPVSGDLVPDVNMVLLPTKHTQPLERPSTAAEGVDLSLVGTSLAATSSGTSSRIAFSGGISGTVTDPNGAPLSGIEVNAYQQQPSGEWSRVRTVTTNASGKYLFALETNIYRLRFRDPSGTHAFEYYDNVLTLEQAANIPVIGQIVADIDTQLLLAGQIEGTLAMFDGQPPQYTQVYLYHDNGFKWEQLSYSYFSNPTSYSVSGLASGNYRLRFRAYYGNQYYDEYYDNFTSLNDATDIAVTAGSTTSAINVVFGDGGGQIAGTVTASADSAPLSGIEATAYISRTTYWQKGRSATTDVSGAYQLTGLDNGTYTVRFRDPAGNYAFEYYNGALNFNNATRIDVTAGATSSGIDAALSSAGHITGTLSMFDGQQPQYTQVYLYHKNGLNWEQFSYTYLSNPTNYNVGGLASGDYRLRFRAYYRNGHYDEYYDNASDLNSATDIAVTTAITTSNMNIVFGDGGGRIAGTVTSSANNAPLSGIEATAHISRTTHWQQVRSITTDASGAYQLAGLDDGVYTVRFRDPAGNYAFEYYNDALNFNNATRINVTAPTVSSGIDVALSSAGHIAGTLSMFDGQQPQDTRVYLYHNNGLNWEQLSYNYFSNPTNYNVGGLASGDYRLRLRAYYRNDWYDEYYQNAVNLDNATDVSVTAGSTTPNVDVIFGDVIYNGRITGTVTAGSVAQEGILVDLYQDYTGNGDWWRLVYAHTDVDGNYSIGALKDGKYRVRFSDESGTYATIYYDGQADLPSAQTVAIANQATAPNINASLTGAGSITGTVTLSDTGGPAEGISVVAYRDNGTTWEALGTAISDASGQYSMGGLFPSDYRLYFQDTTRTYRSEYYDNVRSVIDGTDVTVQMNTVTDNINVTLDDPADPLADVSMFGNSGSVVVDPWTGEVTITFPRSDRASTTIRYEASCADGSAPTNVTLWMNSTSYSMNESPAGSGVYFATIPANDITNATLTVRWECNGMPQEETIGEFVLYDPSGYITDSATGDPVEGATVTLYRVPNWLPDIGGDLLNCRTVDTRSGPDWSSEPDASIDLGVVVNPEIGLINGTQEISPTINPQITDGNGYYGWDVVRGCWYVVVQAEGYESRVSPVVGVPPEVTDLDLKLTPLPPVADFTVSAQYGQAPFTVVFTDTSTGTVTDRLWDFGDGDSSQQVTLTHTYADVGVYSVALMVENPSGRDIITKTNFITVTDTPLVPDIDVDPTSLSATQGEGQSTEQTLTISNNGTGDLEWSIIEEAAARRRPDKPLMQEDALPEGQKVGAEGHSRFAGSQQAVQKAGQMVRAVAADAQSLTHSASQEITDLNSTSCQNGNDLHRDNSYYRVFDLSGDFDINEDFEVTTVEFGVQLARGAGGEQPLTVNLYTLDGSFVLANLTAIGSAEVNLPDQSLTIASVPVSGTVPAGSTLVVELFTPSGVADGNTFFVGSNNQGQTDPSYIRAPFCGVSQPTDITNIGAANVQLVMNVTGDISRDSCSASDIPWVSASPSAGTTAPGNADDVTLSFNSTGLAVGSHSGQLCIESNDPDQATVKIPVSLTVTAQDGDFEITDVTPRYGMDDVSSAIYIYGHDFSEPLTVRLGPTQTLDVDFVMLNEDPQRIRAVVPRGMTPGVYDITVQTESGRVTLADAYEVLDAGTTDDLLSSGEWMWTEPKPMRVGFTNSRIGLLVQHLGGTATLDSVTVEFRLDSPVGQVLGRTLTNLLAPDAIELTGPVTWEPTEPSDPEDDPKDYTVCAIIDPDNEVEETNENNNQICQVVTVLPPHCLPSDDECNKDTEPPEVDDFTIADDAQTTNQQDVTLGAAGTDYPLPPSNRHSGMGKVKPIEFEYFHGARRWAPVKIGDWVDYDTAQSDYAWQLIPSYGMRYMQAWAADNAQNISLKPGVDVIDLLPTEQADRVGRDGVKFYRIFLKEGQRFAATMTPESRDPDMYVWLPDGSLRHNVNSTGPEAVEFDAPFDGTYQIEIHNPNSGRASYRLEFGATRTAPIDDPTAHSRSNKATPEKPAVPLDQWPEFYDVGTPPLGPDLPPGSQLYLPLVIR